MTAETEALTRKIAIVTAELANKDVVIKEKDATIVSLTAQLAQKEKDTKFDTIVKSLPAGMTKKAEDVAALKELSTADPLAFALVNGSCVQKKRIIFFKLVWNLRGILSS